MGSSSFVQANDPQLLIGALRIVASLPLGLSLSFTFGIGHCHGDDRSRNLAHIGLLALFGMDDDPPTVPGTLETVALRRPPIRSIGRILTHALVVVMCC
ncbi:hypothetical protein [Nocardia farcinica]|uniref:hypothetical protein n=1 Tax=Nocardia farcinica TaxID=37329 RepID=UPI0018944AB7|nr:hypothetical protein [Nocardia farcinica]MBF6188916.1 hypothetical protein [Nocardia farcinica]MBF6410447.1 hypothetical protein [Nocardia farcinica]